MYEKNYKYPSVFLDSDILISSFISNSGAAYKLLNNNNESIKFISNYSVREINLVLKRLDISGSKLEEYVFTEALKVIDIKEDKEELFAKYGIFTLDVDDCHIIAGAILSNTNFLLTYNLKHYKIEEIKRSFNINIMTPGNFLQYIRSKLSG